MNSLNSANPIQISVDTNKPGPCINKNVYGQFAEHLGRLLYDGMWVGRESPIPNTRGWRNDVLTALQELHVPVVRWPGGVFADVGNCWKPRHFGLCIKNDIVHKKVFKRNILFFRVKVGKKIVEI